MQKLGIQKVVISLMLSFFFVVNIQGQKLVSEGNLPDIQYTFSGPSHYKTQSDIVHALAYAYSTEIKDIKAVQTYCVHYKTYRTDKGGFQTILTFKQQKPQGHLSFYSFHKPNWILPQIESLKLFMTSGDEFIYVKPFVIEDDKPEFSYTFKHQRFSSDWDISLRNIQWKNGMVEDEFNHQWDLINDYKSAFFLLEQQAKITPPQGINNELLYKLRWLALFDELEIMEFYKSLIIHDQTDPRNFSKELSIRKYVLSKEIEKLKEIRTNDNLNIEKLTQTYIQVEKDFISIAEKDFSLYSNFYLKLKRNSQADFCLSALNEILGSDKTSSKRQEFDTYYQELSMQMISSLIEEKQPNWALYQIEKFEAFSQYATDLKKSDTFHQFKSKAVYDIYLSYIEVARKAIKHNKIDMAMEYLDQASTIHKKYPQEIINDMYVDKELKNMIKRALDRYQQMLEEGDIENAERIKSGVMGLIKRYSLNENFHHLRSS
jgi:hypothetical protein